MLFGWRVVKHVKSNAIVYAGADDPGHRRGPDEPRGFQPDRRLEGGRGGLSLKGSVVCGDAFFPFPDGLIAAAEAGATAAIQPGGSLRDAEVIAAADAPEPGHGFHRRPAFPALIGASCPGPAGPLPVGAA